MPGPRAGYGKFAVRVHSDILGGDVEVVARHVASPAVHRRCQQGEACTGAGCRIRTGKTTGMLASEYATVRRNIARTQREGA